MALFRNEIAAFLLITPILKRERRATSAVLNPVDDRGAQLGMANQLAIATAAVFGFAVRHHTKIAGQPRKLRIRKPVARNLSENRRTMASELLGDLTRLQM